MSMNDLTQELVSDTPLYQELGSTVEGIEEKTAITKQILAPTLELQSIIQKYQKDAKGQPNPQFGGIFYQMAKGFRDKMYESLKGLIGKNGIDLYLGKNKVRVTIDKYLEPIKRKYDALYNISLDWRETFIDQIRDQVSSDTGYLNAKKI